MINEISSQDYLFIYLRKILIGMVLVYLAVDCFNGVLLRIGIGISISQLFKMAILFGILLYLIRSNLTYFLLSLALILAFIVPPITQSLSSGETSTVVGNIGYNLKLLLFPISFFFFASLPKYDWGQSRLFKLFAWFNFALIATNILLGVMGIGYSQYNGPEGGIGGRGFFFAGNEVAGIFVLFSATCWYLIRDKSFLFKSAFFIFLLLLGILNASKTAILGILLIISLLEIDLQVPKKISLAQLFKYLLIPIIIIAIPVVLYIGIKSTGLIDRISFFYQRMDILTFILSGRNQMVLGAMTFYPNIYSFWDYLLGLGNLEFLEQMRIFHGVAHTIEIDFFDLLFMNGFLGVVIILGFYLLILIRSIIPSGREVTKYMWAVNLILILISFMAGHVFNSAMLGISLGFFNGLPVAFQKT
ncbi:O-antigen ligase family protein [Algoriphagus pacificus]|uniref:O-antigen ligase family protein n=1 Tax=Algoriphagus pacificus TaxID=2811234 RepID=A0ABS3CKE5_9BACT|nr:O-antigen ligase family protein [Algoriphagus pacificus]MBN7817581.1 O-antigen ligase family protein [Algoriphagus pacificus]